MILVILKKNYVLGYIQQPQINGVVMIKELYIEVESENGEE